MQSFFESIGAKTNAALEVSKVKKQIETVEKEIAALKYALGCKVFDDFAAGTSDSEGIAQSCEVIREKLAQIPLLYEKIDEIEAHKQETLANIEADAKARAEARAAERAAAAAAKAQAQVLDTEVVEAEIGDIIETVEADIEPLNADGNACPKCGEANPAHAKFCAQCGSKL